MNKEEQEFEEIKKRLAALTNAARQMRRFQKLYFKNRMQGDLKNSIAWEKTVDKIIDYLVHEGDRQDRLL